MDEPNSAKSNNQGRAFEFIVRKSLAGFAIQKGLVVEVSPRSKDRDIIEKQYFEGLDEELKKNFLAATKAFLRWVEGQGWFKGAKKLELDWVPDNEAKKNIEMTDIRLKIHSASGTFTKDISVKHQHDALCHPRLPSLPQQCGIADAQIINDYKKKYAFIWQNFYTKVKTLGKKFYIYKDLDRVSKSYRYDELCMPLQQNAVDFLEKNANTPEHAAAFFTYLVGSNDYYVLKNEKNKIKIKHFVGVKPPTSFKITYPFSAGKKNPKLYFLIEFDNGWKISCRVHTASSKIEKNGKIFMTEKENPICENLDSLIQIDEVKKAT